MKKLIGTVAVAAMLAGAAFAEGITFGSWGRGMWVIGNAYDSVADESTVVSDIHQSWNGPSPRTALSVHGDSENVGFALDLFANGTTIDLGGDALVYAKPIEQVKITIAAAIDQNVLMSNACFGLWGWDRIGIVGAGDEEGWIFPDLLDRKVNVIVTPIEGLLIGAGFNPSLSPQGYNQLGTDKSGSEKLVDKLGRTGAIAAAYTIADVGTIKVGIEGKGKITNNDGDEKDNVHVNAAFELTAVENMYAAVGADIPFANNVDNFPKITAYWRMGFDAITVHVLGGLKLNSPDAKATDPKKDGQVGFRAEAGLDYAFDNGLGLFADIGYANGIWMAKSSADNMDCFTFGVGLTKGFSNGVCGVAFEGATNNHSRYAQKEASDFAWEIPVKVEYWF